MNSEKNNSKRTWVRVLLFSLALLTAVVGTFIITRPKTAANLASPEDSHALVTSPATETVSTSSEEISEPDYSNIILVFEKGKKIPLADYPDQEYLERNETTRKVTFADLDNDGTPELLTEYYTGGAHCCMAYDLFRKTADNTYERFFTFDGGFNSLSISDNKLEINFSEQLGYFFTCYACDIEDEMPDSTFKSSFKMVLAGGEMQLDAPQPSVLNGIIKDLEYLRKRPVPDFDELNMDDGTRKAFAMRIITYLFNSNGNVDATRRLFYDTYRGSDKDIVWGRIQRQAAGILDMDIASELKKEGLKKILKNIEETLQNED